MRAKERVEPRAFQSKTHETLPFYQEPPLILGKGAAILRLREPFLLVLSCKHNGSQFEHELPAPGGTRRSLIRTYTILPQFLYLNQRSAFTSLSLRSSQLLLQYLYQKAKRRFEEP